MRTKFTGLVLALVSSTAFAGWNSGGGHVATDADNPWFLQNTPEVRYCIEIDAQNFGQTIDVARDRIHDALTYWRGEYGNKSPGAYADLRIAQQRFTEVDCGADVDLKFQLGTLTAEQAAFLGKPREVVGVAVRTDYDVVNLRGKGFVYISPASGPYALTGGGLYGQVDVNRWALGNGKILEIILAHELGHVFGLKHGDGFVMREMTPGLVVTSPFAAQYAQSMTGLYKTFLNVQTLEAEYHGRVIGAIQSRFVNATLGLPNHDLDVRFVKTSENVWTVYAGERGGSVSTPYSTITLNEGDTVFSATSLRTGELFVTPDQKVFSAPPPIPQPGRVLQLGGTRSRSFNGVVRDLQGHVINRIRFTMTALSISFDGHDVSGNIIPDVMILTPFASEQ